MVDMNEPKDLELLPQEWQSEREKPHEPIFGPGWPPFVGMLIGVGIVAYFGDGSWFIRIIGPIFGAVCGMIFAAFQR